MLTVNQICEQLARKIERGEIDNSGVVKIIELLGGYLNIQTRSDYAKASGKSYNGAKKNKNNIILFNVKFVIDNE